MGLGFSPAVCRTPPYLTRVRGIGILSSSLSRTAVSHARLCSTFKAGVVWICCWTLDASVTKVSPAIALKPNVAIVMYLRLLIAQILSTNDQFKVYIRLLIGCFMPPGDHFVYLRLVSGHFLLSDDHFSVHAPPHRSLPVV